MVQFARAVRLEVSLATFGMLEDLLLRISPKTRQPDKSDNEGSAQSHFPSKTGSTLAESVAFRSFYSLPFKTESVANIPVPDYRLQQPCCSHHAGDAFGFSQVQFAEIASSTSLKTSSQLRSIVGKRTSAIEFKWSRDCRLNSVPPCRPEHGVYISTEEMLELAFFSKIFVTGPEDTSKKCHCFYCLICKRTFSMEIIGNLRVEAALSAETTFGGGAINFFALDIILQKCADQVDGLYMGRSSKLKKSYSCN